MLGDPYPDYGRPLEDPQAFTLHVQTPDVETGWQRAVECRGAIVIPLQVMRWGDRYEQLRDPFGVLWSIGGPVETV